MLLCMCMVRGHASTKVRSCAQDYESLKEHLKGEAVKEFIKYTAKENVRCPTCKSINRVCNAISLHALRRSDQQLTLLYLTYCVHYADSGLYDPRHHHPLGSACPVRALAVLVWNGIHCNLAGGSAAFALAWLGGRL